MAMSLVPRWEVMTDEAKALTKRVVLSAVVLLICLSVLRALIGWVIIALLGYGAFKWLSKSN